MDLFKKQTMHCIIYHNGTIPLEVLAMHIRCKKSLIAYHKSNNIITMEKCVESDLVRLLNFL